MLTAFLSFLFGFALWVPAFSIPIGGVYFQLSDIFAPIYLFIVLFGRGGWIGAVSMRSLGYAFFLCVGWFYICVSNDPINAPHFFYYVAVLIPYFIAITDICHSCRRSEMMISGLVFGNVFSLVVAFFQAIGLGGLVSVIRNNNNFVLLDQGDRIMGLMPEASSLAHLLVFSSFLLIALRVNKSGRPLCDIPGAVYSAGFVAVIVSLNLLVLTLTRSTSVVATIPLFIGLYFFRLRGGASKRLVVFLSAMAIISVFMVVFISIYLDRGDTAGLSAGNRFSTIMAVALWAPELDVNGVGIGNNSQIIPYVYVAQEYLGIQAYKISEGINSLVFSRIFEEGVLAMFTYFIVILSLFRYLFSGVSSLTDREFFLLSLILWSFLVSLGGAGYRGLMNLWLCVPLAAYIVFEGRAKRG